MTAPEKGFTTCTNAFVASEVGHLRGVKKGVGLRKRVHQGEQMTTWETRKPTDGELDVLRVLWDRGPCTVRDVHEVIGRERGVGYTTVLKIMQIMLDKGLLQRDDSRRTHIYAPLMRREEARTQALDRLMNHLFSGSAAQLVLAALADHQTSGAELAEIRAFLDKKQGEES